MIEVDYYEIPFQVKLLSEQLYPNSPERNFWANATKYAASKNNDEPFVSEIAYVMVTLHRTGA